MNRGQLLQGRYEIRESIAKGGMGSVYRAWDIRLNVAVAVKEMISQPGIDSHTLVHLRQQFHQEAQVLARLNHPNLVRVTDFFEEGGSVYLVMDFIEGESIADRISRQGALPEDEVLHWADQVLGALVYCHAQGVIHRDVKPQNIIIQSDGRAVLVDFGLVKLWDPRNPRTQEIIRGMGTPGYAPPEQYDPGMGHTDARSDIYSLGATLYHALTGQSPPSTTMRSAGLSIFRPPRVLNPRISPGVEAAVLRAMELAMTDRFQSAAEMRSALGSRIPDTITATLRPPQGLIPAPLRFGLWGPKVWCPDDLVELCDQNWRLGVRYLYRGTFEQWLRAVGYGSLADQAESIRREVRNRHMGLEQFLQTIRPSLTRPHLQVSTTLVDFGSVKQGETRAEKLRILNSTRGYLHARVSVSVPWIQATPEEVGCHPNHSAAIKLKVLTDALVAGESYRAHILIATHEDSVKVIAKLLVAESLERAFHVVGLITSVRNLFLAALNGIARAARETTWPIFPIPRSLNRPPRLAWSCDRGIGSLHFGTIDLDR
ncbi:MAG: serine/threonine protein kinase, partial [Anaerolineae bacterium]|nr:serine/threonine protein kinase [Anaerolineae bacterium]